MKANEFVFILKRRLKKFVMSTILLSALMAAAIVGAFAGIWLAR